MLSLNKTNQRYQQILSENKVKALDATLIDPEIPFEDHLKSHASVGVFFPESILMLKHPVMALNAFEDMRVVQFKKDSDYQRWFAIRSPRTEPKSEEEFEQYAALYDNNFNMYLKLKEHKLFMPIHALCIKQPRTSENKTPFLVFPYYQGSLLASENSNNRIAINNKVKILKCVKHALLHLHDCGINPHGLNLYDMILSNENEVKMMNFDHWHEEQDPEKLAVQLYALAHTITSELAHGFRVDLPVFNSEDLTSKYDLNQCIDTLIDAFGEAEYSHSNRMGWW